MPSLPVTSSAPAVVDDTADEAPKASERPHVVIQQQRTSDDDSMDSECTIKLNNKLCIVCNVTKGLPVYS